MTRHMCLVVVLLAVTAMTACKGSNRPSQSAPSRQTVDCARECGMSQILGEDFKPDEVAPQCKNVSPMAKYQACIKGVVSKMVDACLTKCRAK